MSTSTTGRPPGDLAPARRRALLRRAQAVRRAEGDLAREVAAAAGEGASWRAIGEAIGLSKAAAGALVRRALSADNP
ncbi:MAG TPA: hypothetical protein VH834_18225 [Solirubrobacteraceae bacterium]|jgi:hypothetical protein